jgi:probable addiction module antidote protein
MKKKKTIYKPFDAAAYLDNDAVIAEYLSAAAEDPNPEVFVAALGDVAKARGMAQIAKDAGLGRESLYKTLSAGAHPRFETTNSVLHALGLKFAVVTDTRVRLYRRFANDRFSKAHSAAVCHPTLREKANQGT